MVENQRTTPPPRKKKKNKQTNEGNIPRLRKSTIKVGITSSTKSCCYLDSTTQ